MKKQHATTKQVVEIAERLRSSLLQHHDGRWSYKHGLSDLDLAEDFGLKSHHVARIRKELFGDLYHRKVDTCDGARLARLESLFSRLCARLSEEDLDQDYEELIEEMVH